MMRAVWPGLLVWAMLCTMAGPAGAVEYSGQLYRDPFGLASGAHEVQEKPKKKELSLEGIIWNAAKPQALIDGNLVKVGDKIGNAQVVEIKKDGVKMRDSEKEFYIRFKRGA